MIRRSIRTKEHSHEVKPLAIVAGPSDVSNLESPVSPSPRSRPPIWVPIILLLVASLAIRLWNLDLVVQSGFWSGDAGWRLENSGIVRFLYRFGVLPALVIGVGSLILWIGSFFVDRLRNQRFLTGFLACALIVGPGLIINVVLKDHFGRPRPRQIEKFGGDRQFAPLGEPTFDNRGRSFPSGHASMGFFWFAPAIYFWSRSRRLAWGWIGLALVHGALMGFARMAQGGHWLSDVIWSGGIVYLSSWLLYFVLSSKFLQKDSRAN